MWAIKHTHRHTHGCTQSKVATLNPTKCFKSFSGSRDETLQWGLSQSRWVLPLVRLGFSSQAVYMFVHGSSAILSSCLACLRTFCLFFPLPSHFIYNVPLSSHLPPTRSPLSGRRREIAVWRLLLNISSELNIYGVFCDQLLISKWGVSGQLSCIPPYEGGGGGVKTNEEPVF